MKFTISSIKLLGRLQIVGKVLSSKNTLPILDNFLFACCDNGIRITASDLETTIITEVEVEEIEGEGSVCIPAKLLLDTLKEFPEQPLKFEVDLTMSQITVFSESGKFTIPGANGEDFPATKPIGENAAAVHLESELLLSGINKTLFAVAANQLRPVMNGISVVLAENSITFAASDAHKLARIRRTDVNPHQEGSFILPQKPASLLKTVLDKNEAEIKLQFDERNASVELPDYQLICRLIEGEYPKYETIIPQESPNKMIIDRIAFLNTLKRVSVFSATESNLVKLELSHNQLKVSAQDIDFSLSANETLHCQYDGEAMEIGFKGKYLQEILLKIQDSDVVIELGDSSLAGIFLPFTPKEKEEPLMLLMPMMLVN